MKKIKSLFYNYFVFKIVDLKDRLSPSYTPLPPAKLRKRVHGDMNKYTFIQVGKAVAQNIRDFCSLLGRDIYSFENILDFGCGCGRIIRNFQDAPVSCHLYGTDIDSELVGWCEKHLPSVRWSVNKYHPPLPFEESTFDLIYGISVFTHLDEESQHAWLRELHRVARAGAIIILSVHGEYFVKELPPPYQNIIHEHGFFSSTAKQGNLLPSFYRTTYHTQEYVGREWSTYFKVIRYLECGINTQQDAVLLQNLSKEKKDVR